MTDLEKEAKVYFENPGFHRLFQGIANRFVSLDRIGGTVRITNLKDEEKEVLEGFLQMDCHHKKNLSISVEKIRKALLKTKFKNLSLETIVGLVITENIYSKKQQKQMRLEKWEETFQQLGVAYKDTKAGNFLMWQEIDNTPLFQHMRQEEKKDRKAFLKNMDMVMQALNRLPVYEKQYVSLPVFAASITGNPHAFDHSGKLEYYLLEGICWILHLYFEQKKSAEVKMQIFDAAGILVDGISNFVTCSGVRGFYPDGSEHMGMKGFCDALDIMQLPLLLVSKLDRVELLSKDVYILENPAVFEIVHQKFGGKKTIICGNGNLRMATIKLLDLCKVAGCQFFYSGDFDPEGLLIAQRLLDRYDEQVTLWHYSLEEYQKAISNEVISDSRLEKCKHISDFELYDIAEVMKKEKRAGYQEMLWIE